MDRNSGGIYLLMVDCGCFSPTKRGTLSSLTWRRRKTWYFPPLAREASAIIARMFMTASAVHLAPVQIRTRIAVRFALLTMPGSSVDENALDEYWSCLCRRFEYWIEFAGRSLTARK